MSKRPPITPELLIRLLNSAGLFLVHMEEDRELLTVYLALQAMSKSDLMRGQSVVSTVADACMEAARDADDVGLRLDLGQWVIHRGRQSECQPAGEDGQSDLMEGGPIIIEDDGPDTGEVASAEYTCSHGLRGCLMPGPHQRDECHDIDTVLAIAHDDVPDDLDDLAEIKVIQTSRQLILDGGLNVFGLDLFLKSLERKMPSQAVAIQFSYRKANWKLTLEPASDEPGALEQKIRSLVPWAGPECGLDELLDMVVIELDVAAAMGKERGDVLEDASVVAPDSKAALHAVYSDMVAELAESCEYLDCNDSGSTYESAEEPGKCPCARCQLHRISDRLWAVITGGSDE